MAVKGLINYRNNRKLKMHSISTVAVLSKTTNFQTSHIIKCTLGFLFFVCLGRNK